MKLNDLSDMTGKVLHALRRIGSGSRVRIAEVSGLTPQQVSGCLSRLDGFGLIEPPLEKGQGWSINSAGLALFAGLPQPEPLPVAEPEPEPPDGPDAESDEDEDDDEENALREAEAVVTDLLARKVDETLSADILLAMEIENDLHAVRCRLLAPVVPAHAARVYREIVAVMPSSIVRALEPITSLIGAHEA